MITVYVSAGMEKYGKVSLQEFHWHAFKLVQ